MSGASHAGRMNHFIKIYATHSQILAGHTSNLPAEPVCLTFLNPAINSGLKKGTS